MNLLELVEDCVRNERNLPGNLVKMIQGFSWQPRKPVTTRVAINFSGHLNTNFKKCALRHGYVSVVTYGNRTMPLAKVAKTVSASVLYYVEQETRLFSILRLGDDTIDDVFTQEGLNALRVQLAFPDSVPDHYARLGTIYFAENSEYDTQAYT